MANDVQILDKIKRNLQQLGITVSADAQSATTSRRYLQAGNMTIHYVDADIQKPMGGIDDSINPYLGIGVANPGVIVVAGLLDADSAIADIVVDATDLRILRVICGHANDISIREGKTDLDVDGAELARLEGHVDLLGMGM